MKTGSAPGMDGLTVGFYLKFWDLVGDYVHKSILYAWSSGSFSISQRRGILKLIPKCNKNPHFVNHLRPICLLNVDLKLLTKTLANRMRPIVKDTILSDQNAFIGGRFIGNSVLDVYSIIEAAEEKQ